jgi:hypothetical protein
VCMYVCSKKKKEQLPYVNLNYRMWPANMYICTW